MTDPFPVVEQAVFSVTLKSPVNAVSLEQATEGVSSEGLRLAKLLASRVTLFDDRYDTHNLFAFFYSRDSVLLGRLTPRDARPEGGRFYLECLFLNFDLFLDVGADPCVLYHESLNTTRFALYRPGTVLQPFSLEREVPPVNLESLEETEERIGLRALALLSQSVLEEPQTFFVSEHRLLNLISSLFSVLPIQGRGNMDFAVGLFFRGVPTRVLGATAPPSGKFQAPKLQNNTCYLDLRDVVANRDIYVVNHPWSVFVEYVLTADAPDYLCQKIVEAYYDGDAGTVFDIGTGAPPSEEIAELGRSLLDDFKSVEDTEDLGGLRPPKLHFDDAGHLDYADGDGGESFSPSDAWSEIERMSDGEEWKNGEDQDRDGWDEVAETLADDVLPDDKTLNSIQIVRIEDNPGDSINAVTLSDPDSASDSRKKLNGLEEDLFNAETYQEQLNRLQKERDGKDGFLSTTDGSKLTDDAPSIPSSRDDDGIVVLSPFAVLSAYFPEKNEILRRLDELIKDVCQRQNDSQSELRRLWRKLAASGDFYFFQAVREEYLRYLKRFLDRLDHGEQTAAGELTVGAIDVLEIIAFDEDDEL